MKLIFGILFLFTLQVATNAWIQLIKHDPKLSQNHGSYCFTTYEDIGILESGETKRIEGKCAVAICLDNKDIKVSGCVIARIKPPCVVVDGDLSKPYPDCCHQIQCPDHYDLNSV